MNYEAMVFDSEKEFTLIAKQVVRSGDKSKLKVLHLVPNKQTNTAYLTLTDKSFLV